MHHHPNQMLEIRFPSGAALSLPFATAAIMVANAAGITPHRYWSAPSQLLRDIFSLPLAALALHRVHGRGTLTAEDHINWSRVGSFPGGHANPFTLHLEGVKAEEPQQVKPVRLSPEVFQDLDEALANASGSFMRGRPAEAMKTLTALAEALTNLTTATDTKATPEDGWGHTTENASVEELLREGAAAEAGTDNHEQVLRQLLGEDNAKGAIEMLLGAIKAQGGLIRQLQEGRVNDLKRLNGLGEWLRGEAATNPTAAGLQQVLMTFGLQLSRIGIEPKCPHCPGTAHTDL